MTVEPESFTPPFILSLVNFADQLLFMVKIPVVNIIDYRSAPIMFRQFLFN